MHPPQAIAVIPARYGSTRFPGKALADIHGKPMIQWVAERVSSVAGLAQVLIATDDTRIAEGLSHTNYLVQMTRVDHASGSDRVWEVAQSIPGAEIILNVQGDEPMVNPKHLEAMLNAMLAQPDIDIMTMVAPITTEAEWINPNIVKAVLAQNNRVLYFSRASIPHVRAHAHARDASSLHTSAYRHIGVYGFRREALQQFVALPPSPLEQLECLEQLRALENGMSIAAIVVDKAPIGVDTPEDLAELLAEISAESII